MNWKSEMRFDQSFSKSMPIFYWKFLKGSKLTEGISSFVLERTIISSINIFVIVEFHTLHNVIRHCAFISFSRIK